MNGRWLATGLCLASLFGTAAPAKAGAWTPEPGHGYAKLWLKWLPGFSYANGRGEAVSYAPYHEFFVATYGDVGIVDHVAIFWHMELLRTFHLEDPRSGKTESHVAPGDPALGVRWQALTVDRFVLGLQGSVRAPLATRGTVQTVYSRDQPFLPVGELRIGAGVWELQGAITWGYGFDRWYMAGSIGYQWRSHRFDDRILWSLEAGVSLNTRWGLTGRAQGAYGLPTGSAMYANSPSGIGNGVSYTGFGIELDFEFIEKWFLGLTLEGGLGFLRRQTGGPVISLAVATQF